MEAARRHAVTWSVVAAAHLAAAAAVVGGAPASLTEPVREGGLLLVVGYQNIQPENIRNVWRTGRSARLIMCLTLAATLVVPLQYAILAGVVLSFLSQILRSANHVVIREILLVDGGLGLCAPIMPCSRPISSVVPTATKWRKSFVRDWKAFRRHRLRQPKS